MSNQKIYDIIGIGIGPFNLGLAALCHCIPGLQSLFIDQSESFNWHPGMMLEGARLQVPFHADLVTLTDPCSQFSFMAYLKAKQKMFRFAIQENYYIKRSEYNDYCQWVAEQLSSLKFNTSCLDIHKENEIYRIQTSGGVFLTKHIVLGVGTVPYIPEAGHYYDNNVFHSAEYSYRKERISKLDGITIIGSGQSAAEIFYDLLQFYQGRLTWFTRSERFSPMDYSKLTLELSTPDYIDYFYSLPDSLKPSTLKGHDHLYKGINHSLISDIYDKLIEKESKNVYLHPNCELESIEDGLELTLLHRERLKTFSHNTAAVILATGYHAMLPEFLDAVRHLLQTKDGGYRANHNYSVDGNNTIFIQNAEHSTHGFNASDLSLGPFRNAVILNTILGKEQFTIEKNITFQNFGCPSMTNRSKN